MLIKNMMISKVRCFTVSYDATLQETLEILNTHQVDGLPVLKGDQYVGTVTRYLIYESYFESGLDKQTFLNTTKAMDISLQIKHLADDEVFEKAMVELKDFPLLAVVDSVGKFLGIVTRFDIIEQFQSAFGVNVPGTRIALTSVDTKGRLAKLAEITRQFHEQIISLVTFDETDKLVRRIILKVEKQQNLDKFIEKLEDSGFRILYINEDK